MTHSACYDIHILLTGTIVPNAESSFHADPRARRDEYLAALRHYSCFAPVSFLENSSYPIDQDPDFLDLPNVRIVHLPLSTRPERGKGYQEFEMIDRWMADPARPDARLLKITGRYLYRNIAAILDACRELDTGMIVDQCCRTQMARTYLFCVSPDFYLANLSRIHEECDDRTGDWIERVLYRRLRRLSPAAAREVSLFPLEPDQTGISGSTGEQLEVPRFKYALKKRLRAVNRLIDSHYLWYAR